ncbi:DUF2911 domain-containing protein [Daejeonella sp.]|uniref:DUF2911 domain-containing protein n=1 Tax=Daejeonella sp. TaxID=2805397 RepID=UPI0030BC1F9C
MIKKLLLAGAIAIFSFASSDAQTLKTPAPSPTTTVNQDFGLANIVLSYSRPGMKGRKIFGDVVPFGKVWRTGANTATTLTFGEEVTIGGTKIMAGKYGLLTIPEANEWTVIISKQTDVTSPAAYKQDQDIVRVKVKPVNLPFNTETFTIGFGNITANSCDLQILWENKRVDVGISTDVESKVMAQIKNVMEKDTKPYFNAAMYYLENGKDLNQALVWFDKAVESNPTAYWMQHQRANTLAKLGKKAEAIAAANKSIELAKKAQNADYVTMNEKLIASLK